MTQPPEQPAPPIKLSSVVDVPHFVVAILATVLGLPVILFARIQEAPLILRIESAFVSWFGEGLASIVPLFILGSLAPVLLVTAAGGLVRYFARRDDADWGKFFAAAFGGYCVGIMPGLAMSAVMILKSGVEPAL